MSDWFWDIYFGACVIAGAFAAGHYVGRTRSRKQHKDEEQT